MNITPDLSQRAIVFSLLASLAIVAVASDEQESARNVAEQTKRYFDDGETQRALTIAREGFDQQWTDPKALALTRYNLAWTASGSARQQKDQESRTNLLQEAAKHYQVFLASYPGHVAATEGLSLVYRDLGQFERSHGLLSGLITANEGVEQRYRWQLAIGDLRLDEGKPYEAWNAYLAALDMNPESDAAPQRMVQVYPRLPDMDGIRIFSDCQRFESLGFETAAIRGYENLIQRGSRLQELGRQSLERWTALRAQTQSLTPAAVTLFADEKEWGEPALISLRKLLTRPDEITRGDLAPWLRYEVRQHVIASALRALAGYWRLEAGTAKRDVPSLQTAERLLNLAYQVAPQTSDYRDDSELKDQPMVKLEAAVDLAALYSSHPELDPDGNKFSELENNLLTEKNIAYGERNLAAMQKFHTVLGLIYSDPSRDRWEAGSMRAAPYHLERAVQFAQQLAEREPGEYQPMPHLTRIHAEGLFNRGQPEKARKLYIEAAQGYIDANDLKSTEETLESVREVEGKHQLPPAKKVDILEDILNTQKELRKLSKVEVDKVDAWLGRLEIPASVTLDPAFMQRQKVRTLTELSDTAYRLGDQDTAKAIRDRAWMTLIEKTGATAKEVERVKNAPDASYKQVIPSPPSVSPQIGDSFKLMEVKDLPRDPQQFQRYER